mgnify:CR=1 FL=1
MPSYDIIPLASDLLDYTIQRVKQKEAEYKPVKAYIMVGDQLVEKLLYDKVKDDGKPHFPKSQTFHLCAELQDCAVRILKGCEAANGRYFETEYEERLKDLDGVLIECQTMEQLINLSYGRKYITGDQCHYWAPGPSKGFQLEEIRRQPCRRPPGGQGGPGACQDGANGPANCGGPAASVNGYNGHQGRVFGCDLFIYLYLPEHEQHQQSLEAELNGNINNNNCNNSNGSRPALMVRSDRVGPKPKAAPSITSKEVTSSLDTKANTLRRCTPPHTEAAGCCWSCPCGTYTAHKEREARRRDDRGPPACLQGCKDPC